MEEMIVVVGERYCGAEERQLTVRKTSVFYPGDGFAAYDHPSGELVFRVDTYGRGPALATDLVLMDPSGASILTLRKKVLLLSLNLLVYTLCYKIIFIILFSSQNLTLAWLLISACMNEFWLNTV